MKAYKTAACLLVLAIALAGCATVGGKTTITPACSSGSVSTGFTSLWSDWEFLSVLAAMTVFTVSILAYVLGYALAHKRVILWAKNQMAEAIIAMTITLFIIGIVSFLCGLDLKSIGLASNCSGSSCNFADVGFDYLSSAYRTMMEGYLVIVAMNAAMTTAASVTIGLAPGGVGAVIQPFAFLGDIAQSLLLASITVLTASILTLTQMILIKMTWAIFVVLFPIGIILRSFGVTRGFGGGLIAIAIGFFLLYPFLVVLFYSSATGDVNSDYSSLSTSFKNAGPSPTNPSWFMGNGVIDFFVGFIGKTILLALLIPILMFMVLVAFVKGLSVALGEEVDVSNLTRLI